MRGRPGHRQFKHHREFHSLTKLQITLRKRIFSKHPYIQCQEQFWLTWVCTYFPDYHVSQGWPYLFLGMGGIALSVLLSYNYWPFVFKCRVIVLLFYFLLEYMCFTMLFLLYNKGNQLYMYIYPLPLEPPSTTLMKKPRTIQVDSLFSNRRGSMKDRNEHFV